MKRGVLAWLVTGLAFLSEGSGIWACTCGPAHPQQDYCHSDVVVKGKIVSSEVIGGENSQYIRYEVQQQKMFKGEDKMELVREVYTPYSEFVCGLELPEDKMKEDYILSGNLDTDGKLHINLCGFNKPWAQVTGGQRAGLNGKYAAACQCTIVSCLSLPCTLTADSQCLWTDGIITRNWAGSQSRHFSCSPQPSGLCQWESLRPRPARRSVPKERQ